MVTTDGAVSEGVAQVGHVNSDVWPLQWMMVTWWSQLFWVELDLDDVELWSNMSTGWVSKDGGDLLESLVETHEVNEGAVEIILDLSDSSSKLVEHVIDDVKLMDSSWLHGSLGISECRGVGGGGGGGDGE